MNAENCNGTNYYGRNHSMKIITVTARLLLMSMITITETKKNDENDDDYCNSYNSNNANEDNCNNGKSNYQKRQ